MRRGVRVIECQSYGAKPDSDAYVQCRLAIDMCGKPIRRRLPKPHGSRRVLDHDASRPWNDALARDERCRLHDPLL